MKAKNFIPPSKPRNFVVKNQQTSGAGAHKDKKKAQKQGQTKHKGKEFAEAYGDVCRVCGQSPCNCTHIHESLEQRLARKIRENVEQAEAARDPKTIQKEMAEIEKRIGVVRDAHSKAKNITKEVKYLDVTDIVVRIQQLAEKAGADMAEFESLVSEVNDAKSHLESAVYALDDLFVDMYRDLENQHSDLQYELEDIQNEDFRQ